MQDDYGRELATPKSVPATIVLLEALSQDGSPFEVLDNFHPAFASIGSTTLVHVETGSAVTFVIVEAADDEDSQPIAIDGVPTEYGRRLAAERGEDQP